jgi:23S rRNA-/tRNA-specific pseudouridylate synthase
MDLPTKDGSLQEAVTVVHRVGFVASKEGAMSVVRCHPLTGRMHQIRRHASMAGHAIIGDAVYGDASSAKTMALHAWKIGWEGAPGGAFSLVCPLPLRWHELWPQADLLPFCHESSGRWKT